MEALRRPRRTSYTDYLAAEQHGQRRHECLDGLIIAMAVGSDEHNAIAGRFAMVLGIRTTGICQYYMADQRFWIPAQRRGRYADGSIIRGAPAHPAHDDQATTNPTVVLEVLSPSSEGDDEGDKRGDFQSLSSLEAYVLMAQDRRRVKVYRRIAGEWQAATYRDGDSFELPALSSPITAAEIYDRILDAAGASLLR